MSFLRKGELIKAQEIWEVCLTVNNTFLGLWEAQPAINIKISYPTAFVSQRQKLPYFINNIQIS